MRHNQAPSPAPDSYPPPERPRLIGLSRPKPPVGPARWLILGGLAIVVGAVIYQQNSLPRRVTSAPPAGIPIRTAQVRKGRIERSIRIPGVTSAAMSASVVAPRMQGYRGSGRDLSLVLLDVLPAGSRVKKGQVVARFDPLYMQNRLLDSEAILTQGESRLRSLRAVLDVKRKRYEQMILRARGARDKAALDLRKAPVLSGIKLENYRLLHEEAIATLEELSKEAQFVDTSELASIRRIELGLELSRMDRERERANLGGMTSHAPIDGIVVLQAVTKGSTTRPVQQGDLISSGQPYLRIMEVNDMIVDGAMNQVDVRLLHLGQSALVRLDAYPDLELPARVVSVGAFPRPSRWRGTFVKTVPLRLKLEQQDERVLPEMTASADLTVTHEDDATIVPRECIFTDNSVSYALVKCGDEWQRREVETGAADSINVSIRSGLAPGDVVAGELIPQ